MNLTFISDKVCWPDETSSSGYSTVGGFPYQMNALSQLFDQTRIVIMERKPPAPPHLMSLVGHNLSVHPLKEPPGEGWQRKFSILIWLLINGGRLWREIQQADMLHIAVPGDLGGIAILLGLLQKKRMFIRHCGTWDQPVTWANHALLRLLETIGDNDRNIVMATGGSDQAPSTRNKNIAWIFSTTLESNELQNISQARPWQPGETLKLITVGRITALKNATAIIEALPDLIKIYPKIHLRIVGDGPHEDNLHKLVYEKKLGDRIEFTGNLDHEHVMQMLGDSHIFVFPTRLKEGFPKAVLEALACGLPVIATRISVIPTLLGGGAGILLDETTSQAVVKAVQEIIVNPAVISNMSKKAKQVAQEYSLDRWRDIIGERLRSAWGPLKTDKK